MSPERRSELLISGCFLVTAFAALGLAVVYWRGGQPQVEGLLLAAAFAGLCAGAVLLSHRLLPGGHVEEQRDELDSPGTVDEDVESELSVVSLSRRKLLVRSLAAAIGALAVAAAFPIRSLGPRPGGALTHTKWRNGRRMITADGRPVRAEDIAVGSLVTAFPEGFAGSADSQVVVVRVDPSRIRPRAGREDWSPNGILAFSKVCTHAGCPVGLYEAERHELLCPCHQSTFDVLDHARPRFGPAAVELPQLPLSIGSDGVLVATGDLSAPAGPAFWRRT